MNLIDIVEYIKNKYHVKEDEAQPAILKGAYREELYKIFAKLGYQVGCEVGVEKGKNAQIMFELIPNLKLFAVDPYKQHPQIMQDKNAVIIEKFSEDAVKDIPDYSLDFVYINGDPSYDLLMLDIILWGRKVRKGGIVSGQAKQNQAVNNYTKVHNIKFYVTDEDREDHKKEDLYPSWFWVKMEDIYPNVLGA